MTRRRLARTGAALGVVVAGAVLGLATRPPGAAPATTAPTAPAALSAAGRSAELAVGDVHVGRDAARSVVATSVVRVLAPLRHEARIERVELVGEGFVTDAVRIEVVPAGPEPSRPVVQLATRQPPPTPREAGTSEAEGQILACCGNPHELHLVLPLRGDARTGHVREVQLTWSQPDGTTGVLAVPVAVAWCAGAATDPACEDAAALLADAVHRMSR